MHKNIVAIISLLLLPVAANACSCKKSNTIEKYEDASMVFIGHITMAEEILNEQESQDYSRRYDKRYIRATYTVREIFKGAPLDGGFVTSRPFAGANCSIALLPGYDYIIFQYPSSNAVSICNGTTHYKPEDNGMTIRTLKRLKNQKRITHHSSGTPNGAP